MSSGARLAGARLFDGETVSETLASVIKDDVRLDRLPAAVPPHARRLVARCLERDVRLWTDDYLAAFAQAADLEFVTLDHGLRGRYPSVRVRTL